MLAKDTLENKTVLITGGTGSLGKKLIHHMLTHYNVKKVICFSRDELKQFDMQQSFNHDNLRFFLGDVRDKDRLYRAFKDVDIVIHAAALKQVPATEYNPFEAIKTNILGAQNIIEAALDSPVSKVVALSTDKAVAPINLYGATKLCSDKLFVAANGIKGTKSIQFSVVRYGNVIGSRGSVIPFFLKKRHEGILPITDPNMTRFNISLQDGIHLILFALQHTIGGEIFIPKIPSYKILDVAEAIAPHCEKKVVGIRPGEKIHEELLTPNDALYSFQTKTNFIVCQNIDVKEAFKSVYGGSDLDKGYHYKSNTNTSFLTVDQIREQIKLHVDPHFDYSA